MEKIFKAETVEKAIEMGLAELNISELEANIEILKEAGTFSKAEVKISTKLAMEENVSFADALAQMEEEQMAQSAPKKVELSAEEIAEKLAAFEAVTPLGIEFISELIAKLGLDCEVQSKVKDNELNFFITGENASKFIGWHGETLDALQTLLNAYLNKDNNYHVRAIVDAGHYRDERRKKLVGRAKNLAKQAYDEHREVALEPMNAYERKIIHSALQDNYFATTRSDGEGNDRHIVIVPKSGLMTYGASESFRKNGPHKTKSFGGKKGRF